MRFFYFSYDYVKSAKKTEWGIAEWFVPKMQKNLGSIPSTGRKGKRQGERKGGKDGGGVDTNSRYVKTLN